MSLPEALARLGELWRRSEGNANPAERRLLRLALLREASRRCHAELSRLLVRGGRNQAWEVQAQESRLSQLRFHPTLDLAWGAWDEKPAAPPASPSAASTAGSPFTGPAWSPLHLDRHDRLWELALALAARDAGWEFFRRTLVLTHEAIDAFARALDLALWPEAIFLCTLPAAAPNEPAVTGSWAGDWYFATPSEARLRTGAAAFLAEHGARELGAPERLT